MRSLFRRFASRRVLSRAVFVLACLVTLIIAFYLFEHWRGKRAWDNYRAAARKAGSTMEISAYLPPDIPDAENYAAVPLIADFLQQPDSSGGQRFAFPETPGYLRPKRNPANPHEFNALEWREYLLRCGWIDAPSSDPAKDILRALERHRPGLAAFHEAGLRPKAKFPLKWEEGFAMRLPHLPNFQKGADLLALRASTHLELGETEGALSDVRDILHIARALENQPILICSLVRIAVIGHCVSPITQGLAKQQWSDEQLKIIAADLHRTPIVESWVSALNVERSILNQEFLKITGGSGNEFVLLTGLTEGPTRVPLGARLLASIYPQGWVYDNLVVINRLFDERIARVDLKKQTINQGPPSDRVLSNMIGKSWYSRLRYPFALAVFPAFDTIESRQLLTLAQLRAVQTACALERSRLAHGRLPATLDELVPEYTDSIPPDPVDGKPLRFRRAEDGSYRLWSIGLNREDDDGLDDPGKELIEKSDWPLNIAKPRTPTP